MKGHMPRAPPHKIFDMQQLQSSYLCTRFHRQNIRRDIDRSQIGWHRDICMSRIVRHRDRFHFPSRTWTSRGNMSGRLETKIDRLLIRPPFLSCHQSYTSCRLISFMRIIQMSFRISPSYFCLKQNKHKSGPVMHCRLCPCPCPCMLVLLPMLVLMPVSMSVPGSVQYRAEPCRAMPCHAVPCRTMPCHAVPYRVMPCHVVPWRAMPCHAVLCRAMQCHAVPCHAMSCHTMPHQVLLLYIIILSCYHCSAWQFRWSYRCSGLHRPWWTLVGKHTCRSPHRSLLSSVGRYPGTPRPQNMAVFP